jgi:hypothetical protein
VFASWSVLVRRVPADVPGFRPLLEFRYISDKIVGFRARSEARWLHSVDHQFTVESSHYHIHQNHRRIGTPIRPIRHLYSLERVFAGIFINSASPSSGPKVKHTAGDILSPEFGISVKCDKGTSTITHCYPPILDRLARYTMSSLVKAALKLRFQDGSLPPWVEPFMNAVEVLNRWTRRTKRRDKNADKHRERGTSNARRWERISFLCRVKREDAGNDSAVRTSGGIAATCEFDPSCRVSGT